MPETYRYERHNQVADILNALDAKFLTENKIMFAGGTLLSMTMGEYRRSDDIDFIVMQGSQALKNLRTLLDETLAPLFPTIPIGMKFGPLQRDQYGFKGSVQVGETTPIKFEIFVEGRIPDLGEPNFYKGIKVPALNRNDLAVQKLLANGDRFFVPVTAHRDVYDLAMLAYFGFDLPAEIARAEVTYTVEKELRKALDKVVDAEVRKKDFKTLEIQPEAEPLIEKGLNSLRRDLGMNAMPEAHDNSPSINEPF
ncbi:Nucleotidyl transferase AbiEii toxin, Type IV TA system [Thalassospira xiamenensis M-5 = DSM 17429]|uniref:Nucleotidyl transferase AbiEii/AbiGii toxin family protein n=1 Tax=Thalassospira xiamenensis M-5 = DSM 17429 TaxID=1123366 RepID=A0AB72UIQ3_9PROT|nr:nucleotidyl transferase AbiEii/AbiGii toxin family protein [Thalassospira xiamenensis]AJD54331.1 hypothetical protein TH3_21293 [Thalassospira xiamenensis M-5 = DSM 17429]SIT21227.1 Nucleotidyl transferase AbiEii toxin, Type IV TA system [Thalassospira xiamenensis M-5 = DSM 17429]